MRALKSTVVGVLLSVVGATACAASIPLTVTFNGQFTDKTALVLAQQVFAALSSQATGSLDPSSGAQPYYYELKDPNTLVLHFQVTTTPN